MKLYATTTSERASKSQGGNDFLEIHVQGEDKRTFLELLIKPEDEIYLIEGWAVQPEHAPNRRSEQYIRYEITKGEKKKGEYADKECIVCGEEGHHHTTHDINA